MNNKKIITLYLFYLSILNISVYSQTLKLEVAQAMERVREGKFYNGSEEPFTKYIDNEPGALIEALKPYLSDSIAMVRLQSIDIIYIASRQSIDTDLRQISVQYIVSICTDQESGNARRASNYLIRYRREDFNLAARDSIISYIKKRGYSLDNVILLAGYLNLRDAIPDIKLILTDKKYSDKIKWTAHLALSRMGYSDDTDYCLRLVKSKTINDEIITNLLPGLIYTRQKAVFDYLLIMLNNNEKNCFSSNPENSSRLLCGYRVMEFLAPVIEDFPIEYNQVINRLKTDNYEKALETTRKWFADKNGDYKIKDDSF